MHEFSDPDNKGDGFGSAETKTVGDPIPWVGRDRWARRKSLRPRHAEQRTQRSRPTFMRRPVAAASRSVADASAFDRPRSAKSRELRSC